jgi:hypothetical protein
MENPAFCTVIVLTIKGEIMKKVILLSALSLVVFTSAFANPAQESIAVRNGKMLFSKVENKTDSMVSLINEVKHTGADFYNEPKFSSILKLCNETADSMVRLDNYLFLESGELQTSLSNSCSDFQLKKKDSIEKILAILSKIQSRDFYSTYEERIADLDNEISYRKKMNAELKDQDAVFSIADKQLGELESLVKLQALNTKAQANNGSISRIVVSKCKTAILALTNLESYFKNDGPKLNKQLDQSCREFKLGNPRSAEVILETTASIQSNSYYKDIRTITAVKSEPLGHNQVSGADSAN